jgi:hypothetical protein
MAWTTPYADWATSTGGVPDAADLNAQWKANLEWLYNPPSAGALRSTALSLASSTSQTNVTFDTQQWDTAAMFSPSSANITIVTAGIYIHRGGLGLPAGAGRRVCQLTFSEAGDDIEQRLPGFSGPFSANFNLGMTRERTASATTQLNISQNSGGNLDVYAFTPLLAVHWIGA